MHELYELKDKLLQELEEYGTKELSAGTLDVVDKLSHAIKNLCKIIEMKEDEEEYSGDMMGGMGGTYARGGNRGGSRGNMGGGSYRGSYEGRGGSYARGRGRNAKRDSMGRYASEMGYSRDGMRDGMEMADQLRDLMDDAPEAIKGDIERLLRKVEQM